jgi:hypothetical protein
MLTRILAAGQGYRLGAVPVRAAAVRKSAAALNHPGHRARSTGQDRRVAPPAQEAVLVAPDQCPDGGRPEVAAWLLGCMEPDDGVCFGNHLMSCGTCRLAAAELEPAAELLLGSYPRLRSATHPGLPAGSWLPMGLHARTLARVRQAARRR